MRQQPILLFRPSLAEEGELEVAQKHFDVVESRAHIRRFVKESYVFPEYPLVIPRYSALPYYDELDKDVLSLGGVLINSYREHLYVADINRWYWDFEEITPKTWMRPEDVPHDEVGPFVLKGATNSRKHRWKTHMFAEDRADIARVLDRLLDDPLIADQGVVVRQYEEFATFEGVESINGLPVTNEHRIFLLDGEVLAAGFYWSEHFEELVEKKPGTVLNPPIQWVKDNVIPRLKDKIRFVVVDVARRTDKEWRVVELNDGCMSGLSCVNPELLYSRLAEELGKKD